ETQALSLSPDRFLKPMTATEGRGLTSAADSVESEPWDNRARIALKLIAKASSPAINAAATIHAATETRAFETAGGRLLNSSRSARKSLVFWYRRSRSFSRLLFMIWSSSGG